MPIDVMIDSTTAKSMGALGLGKLPHIEVKLLWVQEAVRRRWLRIIKILEPQTPRSPFVRTYSRRPNPADHAVDRGMGVGLTCDSCSLIVSCCCRDSASDDCWIKCL